MIESLQAGMRVALPSGNTVVLRSRLQDQWLCEYTRQSRLRGEVEFSEGYLKRFGQDVTSC
jgi:hypothetical protein